MFCRTFQRSQFGRFKHSSSAPQPSSFLNHPPLHQHHPTTCAEKHTHTHTVSTDLNSPLLQTASTVGAIPSHRSTRAKTPTSYIEPSIMTTQHTAPTARTREKITGDEEAAADLKLGEFQNVPTLTLSEARLLINAVMDHRKGQRKVEETEYALQPPAPQKPHPPLLAQQLEASTQLM